MWFTRTKDICFRGQACALAAAVLLGVPGHAALEPEPVIFLSAANATGLDIQKALDSLPANGEVVLGPGQYEISQPLLLRHNDETLRGSGDATILHLKDGANCPVIVLGPPMKNKNAETTNLRVCDLHIDGNRKHQKREFWRAAADGCWFNNNGIQIWKVSDAVVEHVTCCRCRSGGLVTAGVRRLEIRNFDSFDNQFDGLACYQTEDSHFDGLRLHDNVAAGISLDLDFDHNSITDADLERNDLGIFMRCSRNNSFADLNISASKHDGVFMAQTAVPTSKGWRLSPQTECVNNDFKNLVIDDCGGRAFRVNDASCVRNRIAGAKFVGNRSGGLFQPPSQPMTVLRLAER